MVSSSNGKGAKKTITVGEEIFPIVLAIVKDELQSGYIKDGRFYPARENPVALFVIEK